MESELAILRGDCIDTNKDVSSAVSCLLRGEYEECIQQDRYAPFFSQCSSPGACENLDSFISSLCGELLLTEGSQWSMDLLSLAVSCLQLFIQNNWTGPTQDFDVFTHLPKCFQSDAVTAEVWSSLAVDGQTVYPLTKMPLLLYMAHSILNECHKNTNKLLSCDWWLMRCLCVQQQVLDAKSASIKSAVMEIIDNVSREEILMNDAQLGIMFNLEAGHLCYDMYEYKRGHGHFTAAKKLSELQVDLQGVMGKRTRFQVDPKSQLVLRVRPVADITDSVTPVTADSPTSKHLPQDLALNDDTVLDKLELTDPDESQHYQLLPFESTLVLGLMENHRRSQADYTIVQEELTAYLSFLLSQPHVWSVQYIALFRRCRMERSSGRRADRAMMQLEELKHCYGRTSPPAVERLRYFYAARLPTSWMVQSELANLLQMIGAAGSALDIYEKLQLWDEAIVCCQQLGKTNKAESMIREQLAKKETASMYCFLGDVTGEMKHYERAWEISGHRSAKAQRCMGYLHLNKQQFNKCLECLERSLNINSLQIGLWFTYGCCAMEAQKYKLAVNAFYKCVALDYDNYEAWANLSTSYVKLNQKEKAFRVLQDAVKCNYDNWRLWDNCLIIGTDCGEFRTVINAYHRLIDLKDKWSDVQVLSILVRAVTTDILDAGGQPASRLLQKTLELFGRLTAKVTNNSEIWGLYAQLTAALPPDSQTTHKRMQYLQKAHRCLCQAKDWEKDIEKCQKIAKASEQLATVYMEAADTNDGSQTLQHLSSAKLMLNNILANIKKHQTDDVSSELRPELRDLCHTMSDQLTRIMQRIELIKASN